MKPDDKLYPYSCIYAKFHDSIPLLFQKSKLLYTKDVIMWTGVHAAGTYIIALQYHVDNSWSRLSMSHDPDPLS